VPVAPYKPICNLDTMGTGNLVYLATPSVIWRGAVPLDLRVPAKTHCTVPLAGPKGRSL